VLSHCGLLFGEVVGGLSSGLLEGFVGRFGKAFWKSRRILRSLESFARTQYSN
jgi:hypothetical protein